MSKSKRRAPTHRIYAVARRSARKVCWMDIGTAFSHKDGKGFDLELQSMPLSAAELVVRTSAEHRLADGSIATARHQRRGLARKSPGSRTVQDTSHVFL